MHAVPDDHVFVQNAPYAFWVRPKGTRAERRQWLEQAPDYIGKQLTVTYQELSEDNKPRFPVGKRIREEDFDYAKPARKKQKKEPAKEIKKEPAGGGGKKKKT